MSGEKREISKELIQRTRTHKLISAVFSASQLSSGGIGVPIEIGQRSGIWYALIGRRTSSSTAADYVFYACGREKANQERAGILALSEEVNRKYESAARPIRLISVENSGEVGDPGFPTIMVDDRNGELMKGINFNLGDSLDSFIEQSTIISPNFPYPFHTDLDVFVKSLFLTRGLMMKPPLSRDFIMEKLVEDAYQHSIGIKREVIRREFQEILREMVGSKVFRVKGSYVTYLTDMTEYRRRYQRNYLSYLEKISKRTIFDYDPGLNE